MLPVLFYRLLEPVTYFLITHNVNFYTTAHRFECYQLILLLKVRASKLENYKIYCVNRKVLKRDGIYLT